MVARSDHEYFRRVAATLRAHDRSDVVIHKLIAERLTELDDVECIIAANPVLDVAYIGRWVLEWGLEERLASLLAAGKSGRRVPRDVR